MNIFCKLGFHEWRYYAFDKDYAFNKEPHCSTITAYQKCIKCNKNREIIFSKDTYENKK